MRGLSGASGCEFLLSVELLLKGGLSPLEAVESLLADPSRSIRRRARLILPALLDGVPFADAVSNANGQRVSVDQRLLHAAAQLGNLQDALVSGRRYRERAASLGRKAASAAAYPAMVMLLLAALITGIRSEYLPGFDVALLGHLIAQSRMWLSVTMGSICLGSVLVAGLIRWHLDGNSRLASSLAVKLPVVSAAVRTLDRWQAAAIARLGATAGRTLGESLIIAAEEARTEEARAALEATVASIEGGEVVVVEGDRKVAGLARLVARVESGAEPGAAATAWEREMWVRVDLLARRLETAFEPLFVCAAGACVLVFVFSFVRPLVAHSLGGLL